MHRLPFTMQRCASHQQNSACMSLKGQTALPVLWSSQSLKCLNVYSLFDACKYEQYSLYYAADFQCGAHLLLYLWWYLLSLLLKCFKCGCVSLKVCVYKQGMWVIDMKFFWDVDTSLLILYNYSSSFILSSMRQKFGAGN